MSTRTRKPARNSAPPLRTTTPDPSLTAVVAAVSSSNYDGGFRDTLRAAESFVALLVERGVSRETLEEVVNELNATIAPERAGETERATQHVGTFDGVDSTLYNDLLMWQSHATESAFALGLAFGLRLVGPR